MKDIHSLEIRWKIHAVERLSQRFKLDPDDAEHLLKTGRIIKKIEKALEMKLYPKRDVKNIKKRWFEARDDLTFVLGYISKKHLNINSKNIIELTRGLYKKLPYFYFTPYIPLPKALAEIVFPSQYFHIENF